MSPYEQIRNWLKAFHSLISFETISLLTSDSTFSTDSLISLGKIFFFSSLIAVEYQFWPWSENLLSVRYLFCKLDLFFWQIID